MKDNYKFVRTNQLSENILIVDGVSATGKKLIVRIYKPFQEFKKWK